MTHEEYQSPALKCTQDSLKMNKINIKKKPTRKTSAVIKRKATHISTNPDNATEPTEGVWTPVHHN